MAPEPEPRPRDDDTPEGQPSDDGRPSAPPVPPGLVLDGGLLRPDEKALAPIIAARQAKWWAELERIPDLAAVLDELLAQPEVQLFAQSIVEATASVPTGLGTFLRPRLRRQFEAALLAAAYRLDADHIPAIHRQLFLLIKALHALAPQLGDAALSPAQLASLVGLLEPVDLRANPPGSGLVHALPLRPGEIVMRFTAASGPERDPYDLLVTEIQDSFGYAKAKDRGGRRRRAGQAKTAAKLARMGLTGPQIAAFLGWPEPGETGQEKKYEKRVNDYVQEGIDLIPPGSAEWETTRRLPTLRPPRRRSVRVWMDLKGPPEG